MQFRVLSILFAALTFTNVEAGDPPLAGSVDCENSGGRSFCDLIWDFSQAPRTYVQIQAFDTATQAWKEHGSPYESFLKRSLPLDGGNLYRAVACDDVAMRQNCVSSTVQWSLVWPALHEMPDYLSLSNGSRMYISREAPLEIQIEQYNVYELVRFLDRVEDLTALPPMTERETFGDPRLSPAIDDEASAQDLIYSGIHYNYEARRSLGLSGK